jgi:hypothetical protein
VNIFDHEFNGMGASEFYRALILPDLFHGHKPWPVHTWPAEDQEDYWIDREKVA